MRVAITGSHGFIGRQVAAHFREEGHHIAGLDLNPTDAPHFDRVIQGSILSSGISRGFEDIDTVRTAAIVEEGGDIERFNRLNVDGARLVAEVAKARGPAPPAFVIGHGLRLRLPRPSRRLSHSGPTASYCDSKIASESILKPLEDETFRVIIVRPGDVIGMTPSRGSLARWISCGAISSPCQTVDVGTTTPFM